MISKVTDTKQAILDIGKRLIRSVGYNAFSYATVAKELKIRNAAIHYHFPAKEDLLMGIIDGYLEEYNALKQSFLKSNAKVIHKLGRFVQQYNLLVSENCICIIGSVASDYQTLPPKVQERIQTLIHLAVGMVEDLMEEGKKKGELHFEGKAKTQALLFLTNLAAGVQLARITGKGDFDAISKQALKQLAG